MLLSSRFTKRVLFEIWERKKDNGIFSVLSAQRRKLVK